MVNKCISIFGIDVMKKGKFTKEEIKEINESIDTWWGRYWLVNNEIVCGIQLDIKMNRLLFVIEKFIPNSKNGIIMTS